MSISPWEVMEKKCLIVSALVSFHNPEKISCCSEARLAKTSDLLPLIIIKKQTNTSSCLNISIKAAHHCGHTGCDF